MRSPKGRSTFTDFSESFCSPYAASGPSTDNAISAMSNSLRHIFFPSGRENRRLLDDIAHETARIPIRRVRLRLAAATRASHHQDLRSGRGRERALPLTETICAFVLAELRLLPALPAVAGEIDPSHARIAAEGDAAGERRGARRKFVARLDVGDE